uniref:Uncharacterized protein n=1 Tax=viral metagenome TaxID=1070528 RepID=A0A6M3KXI3_9ZZZZ
MTFYKTCKSNDAKFYQEWQDWYPFRWEIRISLFKYSYGVIF